MRFPSDEETQNYPQRRGLPSRKTEAAMQNVLILAPPGQGTPGASLFGPLTAAGYEVARSAMDDRDTDDADACWSAPRRTPSRMRAASPTCPNFPTALPRHLAPAAPDVGGRLTPPPTLALLRPRHLGQPIGLLSPTTS